MLKRIYQALVATLSIESLGKLPLQKIMGARLGFFGLDAALAPLAGLYGGIQTTVSVYIFRTALSALSINPISAPTLHIPTAAASLYLATESKILRAVMPLSCIIAFLAHPVGAASASYTLYWIVPVVIGSLKIHSIFVRALGATLTAHAVGSTLWLYTHTTTPLFWHALIGIVWIERLMFALCITAAYYGILYVRNLIAHVGTGQHPRSDTCQSR